MFVPIRPRAHSLSVATAVVSAVAVSTVHAATVTLSPAAWSSARDGGTSANPVVDGHFDALLPGSILYVRKTQGTLIQSEYRAAFEFVLPDGVLQPGVTINNVTLTVPTQGQTVGSGYDTLSLYGYVADNTLTLSDFSAPIMVAGVSIFSGLSSSYTYIYPTSYLQIYPGSGNHRVGFVAGVSNWGTSLVWGSAATLQIDYTAPTGSAPSLTVLSPADGATYAPGGNISLQANLSDAEDGNGRNWSIRWASSVSGYLGDGGNLTVTLPAGPHLITATAVDTDGNTVAVGRMITVM
jgi:hypothetical protein